MSLRSSGINNSRCSKSNGKRARLSRSRTNYVAHIELGRARKQLFDLFFHFIYVYKIYTFVNMFIENHVYGGNVYNLYIFKTRTNMT